MVLSSTDYWEQHGSRWLHRPLTSTWTPEAAQPTDIDMVQDGGTDNEQLNGPWWQHGLWTSTQLLVVSGPQTQSWLLVAAQIIDISMATGRVSCVMGVREGYSWWRNMSLPSRVSRVVCSNSLELVQTQAPNKLSSHRMALALNIDRMSWMKNGSFLGLNLLKIPPRSTLLQEVLLVSADCNAAPGHEEAQGPCGCPCSMIILTMCFTLPGSFVIVLPFYLSHSFLVISYILSSWNIVSKTIALHHSNCKISSLPFFCF